MSVATCFGGSNRSNFRAYLSNVTDLPHQNIDLIMPATISKGHIVEAVAGLPEDATIEDAIERLLLLSKIEQGLAQAQRGETISHEEVKRRIEAQITSWQP